MWSHLLEMGRRFSLSLLQAIERSAAELQLAAGLQGHAPPILLCSNDVSCLHHRSPAVSVHQALEDVGDLLVSGPLAAGAGDRQLLMLCANPAK